MKSVVLLILSALFLSPCLADETTADKANRLAKESSPYLLLHAHNPVDWYPWGPEALEKAKAENKLIFLSVGYSSCYWCHVMERKVFSNSAIAAYMNKHFVNIKVDREERPDVDDVYMTSLIIYNQLIKSRSGGGWPLSMFLTPDGNPIAGATYIAPEDSPVRGAGFPTIARRIHDSWQQNAPDMQRTAQLIAEQVQKVTRPAKLKEPINLTSADVRQVVDAIVQLYDPEHGGVDFDARNPKGPRFPNVTRLLLLLNEYELNGDTNLLKIVQHSLRAMAAGGIRDHLAGGFHRYSTDREWKVPHFEKMLYDQAMLLQIYARTAAITNDAELKFVASEIADFVQQNMTTEQGGFCSAIDAETDAIEGKYYVWSEKEVEATLGKDDAKLFGTVFGFDQPNTFEHGIVLRMSASWETLAKNTGISIDQLKARIASMKQKLLVVRDQRDAPLLDDKVLTSWNALMIEALAVSGKSLKRPQDLAAAEKAASFLLTNLSDDDQKLKRTWRNGKSRYAAYLDDYAFTVSALLQLNQSTGQGRWLQAARQLHQTQKELFYDDNLQACYYTANNHEKLIARTSTAFDSVFPSGNSVTVRNQFKLASIDQQESEIDQASKILFRFSKALKQSPSSCSGMALALNDWVKLTQAKKVSNTDIGKKTLLTKFASTHTPQTNTSQPDEQQSKKTSGSDKSGSDKSGSSKAGQPLEELIIEHSVFRPVLLAPNPNGFVQDDKPKVLKVKIFPMFKKIPAKGKCLVAIELQVKFGWHINANPSNPDFLVPTTVTLKTDDKLKKKVKLSKIKYPKHHTFQVQGAPSPYHVYDGKQIVYAMLETDGLNPTKTADLEFHVQFQGCNSTQCLPPDELVMKGKLPVAAPGEKLEKINAEKFPKPKKPSDKSSDSPKKSSSSPSSGS